MSWAAERTSEFDEWWQDLTDQEQRKVVIYDRHLRELAEQGGKEHQDAKEKKAVQRAKQGSQKAPRRRR